MQINSLSEGLLYKCQNKNWINKLGPNIVRSLINTLKIIKQNNSDFYNTITNFINEKQINTKLWGLYSIILYLVYSKDVTAEIKKPQYDLIIKRFIQKIKKKKNNDNKDKRQFIQTIVGQIQFISSLKYYQNNLYKKDQLIQTLQNILCSVIKNKQRITQYINYIVQSIPSVIEKPQVIQQQKNERQTIQSKKTFSMTFNIIQSFRNSLKKMFQKDLLLQMYDKCNIINDSISDNKQGTNNQTTNKAQIWNFYCIIVFVITLRYKKLLSFTQYNNLLQQFNNILHGKFSKSDRLQNKTQRSIYINQFNLLLQESNLKIHQQNQQIVEKFQLNYFQNQKILIQTNYLKIIKQMLQQTIKTKKKLISIYVDKIILFILRLNFILKKITDLSEIPYKMTLFQDQKEQKIEQQMSKQIGQKSQSIQENKIIQLSKKNNFIIISPIPQIYIPQNKQNPAYFIQQPIQNEESRQKQRQIHNQQKQEKQQNTFVFE